jgi:hypothetical protein
MHDPRSIATSDIEVGNVPSLLGYEGTLERRVTGPHAGEQRLSDDAQHFGHLMFVNIPEMETLDAVGEIPEPLTGIPAYDIERTELVAWITDGRQTTWSLLLSNPKHGAWNKIATLHVDQSAVPQLMYGRGVLKMKNLLNNALAAVLRPVAVQQVKQKPNTFFVTTTLGAFVAAVRYPSTITVNARTGQFKQTMDF